LTFPFISLVLVAIQSQEGFDYASALMAHFIMKSALTLYVAAIVYHFFSGLRHLAMDFGYWETLKASRYSAMIVYLLFLVMTVIFSFLIW
jgi:succinate dehydrogenase / fumarate reductase cytochrome b subunit